MNFTFRPASYFDDAIRAFIATIKGESRKRTVLARIQAGDTTQLEGWLIKSKLTDDERESLSSIHPSLMGGEFLPDFLPGEVEIARISLESVTADVISVRAQLKAGRIHYRIVDEYETEYVARPAETTLPLTLRELIEMLDGASGAGTESFIDQLRANADPDGTDPESALSIVTVTSDFYPELERYYQEKAEQWVTERENHLP